MSAPTFRTWLHGSPYVIGVGDYLLPGSKTGRSGHGPSTAEKTDPSDRVYIFGTDCDRPTDHLGTTAFFRPEEFLYQVEPIGEHGQDPTNANRSCRCCSKARVLRCLHDPRTRDAQPRTSVE